MATLKQCDCGRGFPAVRYRPAPQTEEGQSLICRLCDDAPHVHPAPILAFIKEVQGVCTSIEYGGNGNEEHIPVIIATPLIHKGRDLLDQFLFPRYRMWETKDLEGRTTVRSGKNYRRIAIPFPGTTRRVPLDLVVGNHV
jgi:hypothetical protein